jgi:hypothetical protein
VSGKNRWRFTIVVQLDLWKITVRIDTSWPWWSKSLTINKPPVYSWLAWWLRLGPIAIAWNW